jgi:hypothetical protein
MKTPDLPEYRYRQMEFMMLKYKKLANQAYREQKLIEDQRREQAN